MWLSDIKCPLEHHDIDILESLLLSQPQLENYQLSSRLNLADDPDAVNIHARKNTLNGPRTSLFGIGGHPEFLGAFDTSDVNRNNILFRDSYGDSLVEIHPGKLTDSLPFPLQSYVEENRPEPSHSDMESTQPFPLVSPVAANSFAYSSSQTYADKLPIVVRVWQAIFAATTSILG